MAGTSYFVIEHQNSPLGAHYRADGCISPVRARDRAAASWRDDVAAAVLSSDPAGSGSCHARQLSRGRVEFGTGHRRHEHEFIAGASTSISGPALSGEVLDIVKQPGAGEVTYEGKIIFRFDERCRSRCPISSPTRRSGRPCTATRPSSLPRKTLRRRPDLDTDDVICAQIRSVPQDLACLQPSGPDASGVSAAAGSCGGDRCQGARAGARISVDARRWRGAGGGGPIEKTRIGWGTHARGMGTDSERPDDKNRGETCGSPARATTTRSTTASRWSAVPDNHSSQAGKGQQRNRLRHILHQHEIGKMPREMVRNSIALFGKKCCRCLRADGVEHPIAFGDHKHS